MKTDYLDLVQFHISPSKAELEKDGALDELKKLQAEGKVRHLGMSGTLPNLREHIAMGVFDEFQIPYSALEREHEADRRGGGSGRRDRVRGGVARGAPSNWKRGGKACRCRTAGGREAR